MYLGAAGPAEPGRERIERQGRAMTSAGQVRARRVREAFAQLPESRDAPGALDAGQLRGDADDVPVK